MIYYKIGKTPIRKKGVLAPMLEYTTKSFRDLCSNYGCGYLFTEMVHINKIINTDNLPLISESPTALQVVGDFRDKQSTLLAIEKIEKSKFKIVDFNFGCPSRKIISTNSGAFLLKYQKEAFEVLKEIKQVSNLAITVKTRLGFENNQIEKIAKQLEKINIDGLSVHGRLATENYSVHSDFESVRKISNLISFPLIYNGDITTENYKDFLNINEFSDLMIGRGALKDPFIFKQINSFLDHNHIATPTKKEIILKYLYYAKKNNENISSQKLILLQLLSGLENTRSLKNSICNSKTKEDLLSLFISK